MHRPIMLSVMMRDRQFSGQSLQPADDNLIGSDLKLMAALTNLGLGSKNFGP